MYRVKGSGLTGLTGRGASWGVATPVGVGRSGVGGGGSGRLRWWAAAIGLALAVLGLFTAVTLWLGFSVTAAEPPAPAVTPGMPPASARPRARQASEATQEVQSSQNGRVRESSRRRPSSTSTATTTPRPPSSPTSTRGSAEVVLQTDDSDATPVDDVRFARDPAAPPPPLDTTPLYEDEDEEAVLLPTGEESELDTSEQRFYIDDDPDVTSTVPSAVSGRHRLSPTGVPPSPHPIPQTPTLSFPRDAHVAPTLRDPPPTPPMHFDIGTPPNHRPSGGDSPMLERVDHRKSRPNQRLPDEKNRYSIRRSGSSGNLQHPSGREVLPSDSLTLEGNSPVEVNMQLNPRIDSNMYSLRNNRPLHTGGRPMQTDEEPSQRLGGGHDIRRMVSNADSGEELKQHLLEEIKSVHARDRLKLSEASPTDEQLNEFLLREMAADSRREDVVQREIPHLEGGNVIFGSLGRFPQNEQSKVQYYVQETPSSTAAPSANSVMSFLQRRVQELHSWLSPADNSHGLLDSEALFHGSDDPSDLINSPVDAYADLRRVLSALNSSLAAGDVTPVLKHLKELYYRGGGGAAGGVPQALRNSSSLLSVGLLAFDLLLLRNVQQIAWGEEPAAGRTMLQDPEVAALNALFVDPALMRAADPLLAALDTDAHATSAQDVSLLEELVDFVKSGARAVLTLGRAYRDGGEALDCVWTLYCRNLDKTARMHGPYGFLARLNGLGLRLLMGEFPLETAMDTILREMSHGWTSIDCASFFPKCSPEVATRVVLQTAMGSALEEGSTLKTISEIPVLRAVAEAGTQDTSTSASSSTSGSKSSTNATTSAS